MRSRFRGLIGIVATTVLACDSTGVSQIGLGEPVTPSRQDSGADGGEAIVAQGFDARPAATPYLGFPELANLSSAGWDTAPAFPGVDFDTPVFLAEAPTTGHLFIAEREGRIWAIENDQAVMEKTLVLDLSEHTQGFNDSGLLSFAFHPEFGSETNNGAYLYVDYAYVDTPAPGSVSAPAADNTVTQNRLSRFTVDLQTLVVDPQSELILIQQQDQHLWHQGGALFFHPEDGFLYLSMGDEGSGGCAYDNCQRLDRDLFGGVLRIDVDQIGGAVSHPIARQPETGATANYFIPTDNPFVDRPDTLEEFYALGLRSPHRMTHDPLDDVTFIGDIGQATHEEINVLAKGANYQWQVNEGFVLYDEGPGVLPAEVIGDWTAPLLDFERADSRAIIGGYVYRGELLPELRGKYIYGDYIHGNIWALTYDKSELGTRVLANELLVHTGFQAAEDGITSFGVDSRGELYFLTMGSNAKIQRLRKANAMAMSNLPATLSETGLFTDLATLQTAPPLIPYDVNTPLWSDGAAKRRWLAVPNGQYVSFEEQGPWSFPVGSVFVKHFEMANNETRPEVMQRLETRVLVMGADQQLYGVTYKWRADGSDADLLSESRVEDVHVTATDGSLRTQRYFYPGPNDCLTCHNAAAGQILGLNTRQLNREFFYHATDRLAHQLTTWQRAELFLPRNDWKTVDEYPRLASLTEGSRSVEDRVKSYWDANCGMCHGVLQDIKATWDARYSTPLADQGVIDGELQSTALGLDGAAIVVPGDPDRSLLFLRDATTDLNRRMPPLGSQVPDEAYLTLLENWILSLDP